MKFKFNLLAFVSIGAFVMFIGYSRKSFGNDFVTEHVRSAVPSQVERSKFLLVTMVNKETVNFKRFQRSAHVNGLPLKVLGLGQEYKGWGEKVYWLTKELEPYKNDSEKIIMFADGFDVLLNAGVDLILEKFYRFNARVVFSGTRECYPMDLLPKYPPGCDLQYLNSGLFIGYAPELYRILTHSYVTREGNDQRFYANNYLELRLELNLKIDTRADLFQTLYFAEDDVELRFHGNEVVIFNKVYNTTPIAVHSNGYAKLFIKTFANYISKTWNPVDGCLECKEDTKDLSQLEIQHYPKVVIGLFITKKSSLGEFFKTITALDYPKEKISIFIGNSVNGYKAEVEAFTTNYSKEYRNITTKYSSEVMARTAGVYECFKGKCDYYLSVDSDVRLDNPMTLKLLIEQNRPIVAPMLKHSNSTTWNFSGKMPSKGVESAVQHKYAFYPPYMDIVKNNRSGLWSVPHIKSCYLIKGSVIGNRETRPYFEREDDQPDKAFNLNMHDADVDRFVSNRVYFGHLV